MSKLILVTGGAGFIGSHLCERLVADGHQVISLDNYFAGSRENHVPGVEYREGHTKDIATLILETPEMIYHLGEYARVNASLDEPQLVWDLNTAGTQAVLEFWRTRGGKLVYAASSTKSESTRATDGKTEGKDLTPYTWAKAANVSLINDYGRWYKLPYTIVYFYNVYGAREREWGAYGSVIETFRQNFLQGRPHKVNAPGTQTRAFTHVADTIDGIITAGERGEGDGFNISAKEAPSLIEVAEIFGGPIEMQPQTQGSRSSGADDTSKLEALGWKQKHTLKEYIESVKKGR